MLIKLFLSLVFVLFITKMTTKPSNTHREENVYIVDFNDIAKQNVNVFVSFEDSS